MGHSFLLLSQSSVGPTTMQIGCSSYVFWYVFWQYLRILLHTALSVNFVLGVNLAVGDLALGDLALGVNLAVGDLGLGDLALGDLALGDLALVIAKKTNHLYIHMRS